MHDFPEYHIDRELKIIHFCGDVLRVPTLPLRLGISSVESNPWDFLYFRDVAQPGSAHGWGPWGRKFKSCHPDHMMIRKILGPSATL